MKNKDLWKPTKYVVKNDKLQASNNSKYLAVSSRLFANCIANFYDENSKQFVKGTLIDLGCGNVPLYEVYKKNTTENICVDWAIKEKGNPYLDFSQDLNQQLQFDDSSFDTIILSDVLEHIRKPDLLMAEMFRILKNNGIVLLNVPFFYWIHEQPYDYYRYTEFALKSIAEDAGFTVIKLESFGGMPEVLADILSKITIRIPVIGKPFAIMIQSFTSWFVKTKMGSKISKTSSHYIPLGYGMILEKK